MRSSSSPAALETAIVSADDPGARRGRRPAAAAVLCRFGFAADADVADHRTWCSDADVTEATIRWRGRPRAARPTPGARASTTCGTPSPRSAAVEALGGDVVRRGRGAGGVSAAWAGGSSGWASTAASRWWTTTRTIPSELGGDARRRAAGVSRAAARGGVPAAPVLAHRGARAGDGRGAGRRRPGGRHRDLRRARAADRRRERPAGGGRRQPARAPTRVRADAGRRRPHGSTRRSCPATSCSRSAPATSRGSAPSWCGGWAPPEAPAGWSSAALGSSAARALVRARGCFGGSSFSG